MPGFAEFMRNMGGQRMMEAMMQGMMTGEAPDWMPSAPGMEGYDFISGSPDPRFCTAAEVKVHFTVARHLARHAAWHVACERIWLRCEGGTTRGCAVVQFRERIVVYSEWDHVFK